MKLNTLFKQRNFWMGFAMVVIILYHAKLVTDSFLYRLIEQFGYAGVDVFVFASGIGCYYSLEKDPDILRFLLRRLRKLGPVHICFTVVWVLWRAVVKPMPISAIFGNFLGLESFVSWEFHFNWYISALVLFYILMPYFKRLTDSFKTLYGDLLVLCFLVIAAIPFWTHADMNMIMYSRIPVFYLGTVFAKQAKRDFILERRHYVLILSAGIAGLLVLQLFYRYCPHMLWFRGLNWYPFVAVTPAICLVLSWVGTFLQRHKPLHWLYWILEQMGIYSFELYLVHCFLYDYLMEYITPLFPGVGHNMLRVMTIPVILIGCVLLNRCAALLMWLFTKTAKRISVIL